MSDGQRSGRSTGRVSCKSTELKRCSMIEMRWNKYEVIIVIIHEYYYGGAVALLLQDQLTMSVTEQSQYLSATVQREHKTYSGSKFQA